mgnify:CR=1 FL=1
MSEEKLREAQIDHEAVRFSMGMALENPDDYSIDEMRELIDRHDVSQDVIDKAMREDFASMPPEMQEAMKKMLKASDVSGEVWKEIFGEDF